MLENRFHKRLSKKAKKGFRGWPVGTVAFYGPDRSHASKVAVGIVRRQGGGAEEMRDWRSADSDVRTNPRILAEILDFLESHGVLSVIMTGGIIGCPHQEGIDYAGEYCPAVECRFWLGRDRFTGEMEG